MGYDVSMGQRNGKFIYILFIFALILISSIASYYRYVILEDFSFFHTEDNVPTQFEQSTY